MVMSGSLRLVSMVKLGRHGACVKRALVTRAETPVSQQGELLPTLEGRSRATTDGGVPWPELVRCVASTYLQCGFPKDAALGPVEMLAAIEAKLEKCLRAAAQLPAGIMEEGEKASEKERRQV